MNHVVEQGECLSRIAAKYGFRDPRSIYDHPQNADLKKSRPDPNLLFPGDNIFIPEKEQKEHPCGTGNLHTFQVAIFKRILKIALKDWEDEPLANRPYELVVEGVTFKGETDGDGVVSREIPLGAEQGSISVDGHVWPVAIAHLNPVEEAPDDGVSGIQSRLKNLGYDPGPIDGVLGAKTRRAIRAFQQNHPPLKVDAVCGPQTKAKLKDEHGC